MGAPQIIWIILTAIGLLLVANQHGKERGKNNFWASLLAAGISIGLLIWGGFFS